MNVCIDNTVCVQEYLGAELSYPLSPSKARELWAFRFVDRQLHDYKPDLVQCYCCIVLQPLVTKNNILLYIYWKFNQFVEILYFGLKI